MQLQKRLDYGFNGYQVPSIPRAARSARKKGPVRKKTEDKQVCAFDVLATVAGKILIDGELAHTSINTSDGNDHCKGGHDVIDKKQIHGPIKAQPCDHGSSGIVSLPPAPQSSFKEKSHSRHDDCSVIASVITSSECLEKGESHQNSVGNDDKNEFSSHLTKLEGHPYGIMEVSGPNLEDHVNEEMQSQTIRTGTDMFYSEDPDFLDRKPLLVTSDTMKASLDKDECPRGSHSLCRDHVNLVSRDDDENSSNCNQPSSKIKSPMCIGDQRIMELSASKHWRAAPRLKDGDLSDTGAETQSVYCSRNNNGYKRQRSQRIYPLKKRKLFRCSSASHSDDVLSCNAMYKTPEKDIDATASGFGAMRHTGNGTTSSVSSDNTSFHSGESHVKVRIKSFQVPELFIEMPQTATIGSLKMTVMEALTTLLGGGLRVGVLLQGKKIGDDNTTLLQSGVCHGNKVESLGFTLEPKSSSARSPAFSKDQSLLLSSDIPVPLSKSAPPPVQSMIHQQPSHPSPDLPLSNMGNFIESDHDSVQSPAEISKEKSKLDSQALVTVPEGTPQALAVVPVLQKSKRSSEMAQRRIRRPFSVSEVEALLEAVEKLGTGRWRDVKMRAFDNVKYRTYVDLKDKWKTLVHTARISPQQRRGEPVPQELLDRVMTAHAYWSHQQSKHQLGHQSESLHL